MSTLMARQRSASLPLKGGNTRQALVRGLVTTYVAILHQEEDPPFSNTVAVLSQY